MHFKKFLHINVGEYNLSSTSGTKIYINLEIPETSVFMDHKRNKNLYKFGDSRDFCVYGSVSNLYLFSNICYIIFYSIRKFILTSLCYNHREVKNDHLIEELPRQFKTQRTTKEEMNNNRRIIIEILNMVWNSTNKVREKFFKRKFQK